MCFVFILTDYKWYIFLKKEIKCHTWKVCGIAKGTKSSDKNKQNRLIQKIQHAMRALF